MVTQHLTYLPWAGLVTLYGSNAKGIINLKHVGFEVLTAASMKMAVFCVVAPCNLVEIYRRLKGNCCPHHQGDDKSLMKRR
jgi:hypothetical protein